MWRFTSETLGTLVPIKIRGRGGGPRPPTCIPTICVSNASPQSKLSDLSVSARQQFYRCVTFHFFSGMLCRKADRAILTKHFAAPHAACHKFCPTTVGRHNDCYQHMSQFFSIFFSIFFQRSFSPTKSLARDILTRQPPGNAIYSLAAPDVQAKPGHIQASAPRGGGIKFFVTGTVVTRRVASKRTKVRESKRAECQKGE